MSDGDQLGPPRGCPRAALILGLLLAEQGDTVGAQAAYRQAVESGHPDAAAMAAWRLDDLRADKVSPPYKIILARGVDSALASVEPTAHSEVSSAISALSTTPFPLGISRRDRRGVTGGPYNKEAGGYHIGWATNNVDRVALVLEITKNRNALNG